QGGQVLLRIEDLHPGGRLDVPRRDVGGPPRLQVRRDGLVHLGPEDYLLEVQDDVRHVLGDLGEGRELVEDALDAHGGDGRSRDGRQQGPPEGVSQRVAEARLERLDRELRARGRDGLFLDLGSSDDEHELPPWRRIIQFCSASASSPGPIRPRAVQAGDQTRRRFLGRHPLCGTGVTSWMPRISRPVAASERIAVSRPDPGPFTNTSTLVRPCSWARRAAASAANWAANGVDFREPLNPTLPALAQDTVFPSRSVMFTMVLLNVDLMCAWPWLMFFFSRRRGFLVLGLATWALLPYF